MGYGLHRDLNAAGVGCIIVAPSLIPKQLGSRVKTDRRDAVKLARFLRSGDLTAVAVPERATEAMRDLERARDDAKNVERSARHQLGKFLLRHGRIYQGKTAWTRMHLEWIRKQAFDHQAQQRVLTDDLHTVEQAAERVEKLTGDIRELVETWEMAPLVKSLQALRGVQLVTAVIIEGLLAGAFARAAQGPSQGYEKPVLCCWYGSNLRQRPEPQTARAGWPGARGRGRLRGRAGRVRSAGAPSRARLYLALLLLRTAARALEVLGLPALGGRAVDGTIPRD